MVSVMKKRPYMRDDLFWGGQLSSTVVPHLINEDNINITANTVAHLILALLYCSYK